MLKKKIIKLRKIILFSLKYLSFIMFCIIFQNFSHEISSSWLKIRNRDYKKETFKWKQEKIPENFFLNKNLQIIYWIELKKESLQEISRQKGKVQNWKISKSSLCKTTFATLVLFWWWLFENNVKNWCSLTSIDREKLLQPNSTMLQLADLLSDIQQRNQKGT